MAITLRNVKGSSLTYAELDGNFSTLNNKIITLENQVLDISQLTDNSSLLFDGNYNNLTNQPDIPVSTSDLINDSGFLTSANLFSGNYNDLTNRPDIPVSTSDLINDSGFITTYAVTQADVLQYQTEINTGTVITESQISDLQSYLTSVAFNDLTSTPTTLSGYGITDAFSGDYDDLTSTPTTLSGYGITDAFSGDYDDLTNKPVIPVVPTNISAFTNDAGYITSETDSQTLSLAGTDLSISNGNTVDLSSILESQTLTLVGTDLSISDGNTVDLSSIVGDSVGNFTFASSVIDTDDSSTITITPAVVMSSDLTVDNDLIIEGNIVTGAGGDPEIVSQSDILLTAETRVTVTQSPFKMASFTTAQRDTLTPENGDTIYNTTTNKFQGYAGGSWVDLH